MAILDQAMCPAGHPATNVDRPAGPPSWRRRTLTATKATERRKIFPKTLERCSFFAGATEGGRLFG